MKKWVLFVSVGMMFTCQPLPSFAVTAWWVGPEILVEADEAIVPSKASNLTPEENKQCNTHETAAPLQIGDSPVDRVISANDENWFVIKTEDGPGFIRIGSTGPINYTQSSSNGELQPGIVVESSAGPKEGATLLERSISSIVDLAAMRRHKLIYLKLTTGSINPVLYRISYVSDLPENRVGGNGPGVAAHDYIMAAAYGNLRALYHTTRIRHTREQALYLRQKLFGTVGKLPQKGFSQHLADLPKDIKVDELSIQHMILSDEFSVEEGRHWAFAIRCEKRDGLWLVAEAYRDPELLNEKIEEIIRRDFEKRNRYVGSDKKNLRP